MREPVKPPWPSGAIRVMVTVDRPPSAELARFDKGDKYRILKGNTEKHRNRIASWLKETDLLKEVFSISEATVFNTLFFVTTSRVAGRLADAPGVLDVSPSPDIKLDLPQPEGKRADVFKDPRHEGSEE